LNRITKEIISECCNYNKGFYELSVESLGLSVDEFTEFLETGEVLVDKLLPALAKKLTNIFEEFENGGVLDKEFTGEEE
jgi:hypothetical protein